jgi:myosin heavy subunit
MYTNGLITVNEIIKFLEGVNWGAVVAFLVPIGSLLGFIIRSNITMRQRIAQAQIDNEVAATKASNEREKRAREDQIKFEKLQDAIRIQMLEERRKTMEEQDELRKDLGQAHGSIIRLHEDLRASEKRESETRIRETMLLNEISRNKEIMDGIQIKLTEQAKQLEVAQKTIIGLQQDNEELRKNNERLSNEINKLRTGTHQSVSLGDPIVSPT